MTIRKTDIKPRLVGREGFVLPAVVFAMAIMSLLAVMALRTASDEQLSSRAVRESAASLYAAEAGVSIIRDAWDKAAVDALASGDSIDTGWTSISGGAAYRGVIMRGDDSGQRLYTLTVHGRGAAAVGGPENDHRGRQGGTANGLGDVRAGRGGNQWRHHQR